MGRPKPKRSTKLRNAVGGVLRAAREAKGFSQAEITAKLQLYGWDLGRTTWTKIELGERTLSDCELIAVADVLGVNLGTLFAQVDRVAVRRVLHSNAETVLTAGLQVRTPAVLKVTSTVILLLCAARKKPTFSQIFTFVSS